MDKPRHSAYFIIELRNDGPFPQFIGCGTFSSSAEHLTSRPRTIFAQLCHVDGYASYQEAREALVDIVLAHPAWSPWARPFLEPGREAHYEKAVLCSFLMRGI